VRESLLAPSPLQKQQPVPGRGQYKRTWLSREQEKYRGRVQNAQVGQKLALGTSGAEVQMEFSGF
jgi:hypothetical protein